MNNNALSHLNIPAIQEDELFSGYLDRLCVLNHLSMSELQTVIGRDKSVGDTKFLNDANAIICVTGQTLTLKQVYTSHTSFRILRFTTSKIDQKNTYLRLDGSKKNSRIFGKVTKNVQYCPSCMKEDIERTGSAWQHIYHNCGNVDACCKHQTSLITGFENAFAAEPVQAKEEAWRYAEWLYKLSMMTDVNACRENTEKLDIIKVRKMYPAVLDGLDDKDLHVLQAANDGFKYYILNDDDLLRATFLLWGNDFDGFYDEYKKLM